MKKVEKVMMQMYQVNKNAFEGKNSETLRLTCL